MAPEPQAQAKDTSLRLSLPTSTISFLRSFSTSSSSPQPGILASLVLSRFPRLRTEDSPNRTASKPRKHPSPLFDRPPDSRTVRVNMNRSGSGSGGGSSGDPKHRRTKPSTSSIAGIIALVDQRVFSKLDELFVPKVIAALNLLVFMVWLYAVSSMKKYEDPRAMIFMVKNFMCGMANMREGRYWTMLTSCFSHKQLDHFIVNMVSLAFMAPPVLTLTGPTAFVLLYLGAGMFSSITSMVGKYLFPPKQGGGWQFSQGASGSVYAIMTAFACVQPSATFLIFFVIPAPAWACVSGIFAWDLWHAVNHPEARTDSAGHLGGIAIGLLFWKTFLRSLRIPA